jgi:DNA polymerase-3 subunit delta
MTKYDDLIRSIKQGTIRPLYLLFGDEGFLVQEAVDLLTGAVVDPSARDFNLSTVYCRTTPAAEIVNLCQTLPFMAERRLVIAKEIEALKAADIEELLVYLKDPSPSTCLVMIANQPRYEKRQVIAAAEARGVVARFYPLLDREMLSWIENWARSRGLTIHRDAAQYVWQTIGNDLQAVSNELQKTAIALKDRKAITYEDVKAVVGDFREYTSFDLADALGRKDRQQALVVLNRLLQEGEQAVGLLGSVAWNFRRLLRAKGMEAGGAGYEEIKKKLNVIFHQSAAFREQMRSYSLAELERVFEVMLAADRKLKTSGLGGRLVLERLVLELCGT